jgi:hypothetical protein
MRCLGADILHTTSQQKQSNGNAPKGSGRLGLQEFLGKRHMKVVRLSALWTGRLYPQEISLPWYSFMLKAVITRNHSAAGRIKSMKNPNDPIWNRTRELLRHRVPPSFHREREYLPIQFVSLPDFDACHIWNYFTRWTSAQTLVLPI